MSKSNLESGVAEKAEQVTTGLSSVAPSTKSEHLADKSSTALELGVQVIFDALDVVIDAIGTNLP